MGFTVAGDFDREPQGAEYSGLVEVLATFSHRAVLMTRHHSSPGPADALLRRLGPWCIVTEERSQWPNTGLRPPNTQLVHEFHLSPEVIVALSTSVNRLYWGSGLPEDLAFLREDGSVVLFSTTHEEEAGLCLSDEERTLLEARCPWLATFVTWRAPTPAEYRVRQAGG